MGVLNMSVESNWKPSVGSTADEAARLAEQMLEEGADIIDVGLQSANPKNDWLPPEVELERLPASLEVLDRVDADDAVFSVETRYAEVAEEAIGGGFDVVNDVCGFADPEMPDVCAAHDVPVVKMASPPDVKKPGHLRTIDDIFEALERDGFTDKTVIDPAFGGWYDEKTFEDNWEMFRRLREFRAFGRPVLTGTNREDFLGTIAGKMDNEDQLYVSLAAATLEVDRGADIIRTHDVPETADVVRVAHHLESERVTADAPRVVELQAVSRRELERFETLAGTEPGVLSESALYCFRVERPDEHTAAALREGATGSGAVLLDTGAGLVLAGSRAELRAFIEETDTTAGAVAEVVGDVRRALTR